MVSCEYIQHKHIPSSFDDVLFGIETLLRAYALSQQKAVGIGFVGDFCDRTTAEIARISVKNVSYSYIISNVIVTSTTFGTIGERKNECKLQHMYSLHILDVE